MKSEKEIKEKIEFFNKQNFIRIHSSDFIVCNDVMCNKEHMYANDYECNPSADFAKILEWVLRQNK